MLKRNIFSKAQELLEQFPVVAVLGARQVGKTTLAKELAPDWRYIDLEYPDDINLIEPDPGFFFKQFPAHIIIDEAQILPELFPVLRSVIDADREQKGRFILTGSSSPDLLTSISETLAGRIAIIELGTFKANELYQQPLSPFYQIFIHKLNKEKLPRGKAPLNINQMQDIWLNGGYPEPVLSPNEAFYDQWMENYRDTYINRDLALMFPRLNKVAYRRFLTMLSQLSGTILNKRDLARAIEVNEKTISEYVDIASGTYLWRPLNSYEKNIEKAVIKMPKGYIRDTGLLHYLLKIQDQDDLLHHPQVGHSFEGFVVEEICKGLSSLMLTNWDVHFYRTRNKAEIDLIIDGSFGVLPIEIKQGQRIEPKQLTTLTAFIKEHNLAFGMIVNQSSEALWLTDCIYQLPVGWL
jgi:predicted AAA+ superfamily ATPase